MNPNVNICPKCGKALKSVKVNGVVEKRCVSCGYRMKLSSHSSGSKKYQNSCVVRCPKCTVKIRVHEPKAGGAVQCSSCHTSFHLPEAPDPALSVSAVCPTCKTKNPVPANRGKLDVRCIRCNHSFTYETGKWPYAREIRKEERRLTAMRNEQETVQPDAVCSHHHNRGGQSRPRSREIVIERLTHAYKEWDMAGLRNRFQDAYPVHIFIDDVDFGLIGGGQTVKFVVDTNAHTVKCAVLASGYHIPAGTEDYVGYYFNGSLRFGPAVDFFRDKLTAFVIGMFRGKGMRDRMRDPNNRNHNVELRIEHDCIVLSRQLYKTRGLKQWALGGDEEKIYFRDIGLVPLDPEMQPGNYWDFIQKWVESQLLEDEQADVERYMGGFAECRQHKLY